MKSGALSVFVLAALLHAAPSLAAKKEEPPPPEPPVKPGTLAPLECVVADFRALGIDTNDSRERRTKALAWLKKYGKSCTAEQLVAMRNNRAAWLGTADNAELAARIDGLLEVFAATNREIAVLLYGTPPVTTKPAGDKTKGPEKK
jgi:hypothetical protein